MQNAELLTTESLAVPGIEVLGEAPEGAKSFASGFYPDEMEPLRRMCRVLRPRERFVVVPVDSGKSYSIYQLSK